MEKKWKIYPVFLSNPTVAEKEEISVVQAANM